MRCHRTFAFVGISLILFAVSPTAAAQSSSDQTAELQATEVKVEAATLRGDAAFLDRIYAADFRFTHGDDQRTVQTKAEVLKGVRPDRFVARDLDSVEVELHGDVAMTTGRIHVRTAQNNEYTVWYVRVYAMRDGRWLLLSHRTVREVQGPL